MFAGLLTATQQTVKETKPPGIKAAFGVLGLNLAAAAGALGVRALEKKVGPGLPGAGIAVPAAQLTAPPEFVERATIFETFKLPLIVTGVAVLGVLGVYVVTRLIRKG